MELCTHTCIHTLENNKKDTGIHKAHYLIIDRCYSYYFVRNSLVALLEALCARNLIFKTQRNACTLWRILLCVFKRDENTAVSFMFAYVSVA